MSIYDEMRTVAAELLGEFQQGTVTYVALAPSPGGTPDDPGEPVPTEYPLTAAVRSVSTKYVDGSHIVQSDRQVAMPNTGAVVPDMSGYVAIDGAHYKLIEIMPRPAAGNPVLWTLIVRG